MKSIDESTCFKVEGYAYNLSTSGFLAKQYMRPLHGKPSLGEMTARITKDQLRALSLALESPCLSTFETKRFSLYDFSFRGKKSVDAVALCFKDKRAGEYLSAAEVFSPISGFYANPLVKAIERLEKSLFPSGVDYNPNWMFGLLFAQSSVVGAKAYVRFDIERVLDSTGRQGVISRVLKEHDAPEELQDGLLSHARWLESCGLYLRFLGVDQKGSGDLRYKFYFRSDGSEDFEGVRRRLVAVTGNLDTKARIDEVFRRHGSGMWGIGISVGALSGIDGYQLYFDPHV